MKDFPGIPVQPCASARWVVQEIFCLPQGSKDALCKTRVKHKIMYSCTQINWYIKYFIIRV